jgi:hypothetical protein
MFFRHTFTQGLRLLGSSGGMKPAGQSFLIFTSYTLSVEEQKTSTVAPVGSVYIDIDSGYKSCGPSIQPCVVQGHDNANISSTPYFSDCTGNCPSKNPTDLSASSILESPPCTSHSGKRNGVAPFSRKANCCFRPKIKLCPKAKIRGCANKKRA